MTIPGGWASWWGSGWGGSAPLSTGFYIVGATATGSNTFLVELSETPLFQSPIGTYDNSNMTNWSLVRDDTSESVQLVVASRVLLHATLLEFKRFGRWDNSLETYTITASNLKSYIGNSLIAPKSATFYGAPRSIQPIEDTRAIQDIYNPQFSQTEVSGGLVVDSAGEYKKESGTQLMKKLMIRRILVAKNEFLHLSGTEYGFGVKPSALYRDVDLVAFRKAIELQVKKEIDLENVQAGVSLDRDGIMLISARGILAKTGQVVEASVPFPKTV